MGNLFVAIYDFFEEKKRLFYLVLFGVIVFLAFFAARIKLKENFMQMLPQEKDTEQLSTFFKNSKFTDRLIVAVSTSDSASAAEPDSMVAVLDTLATRLKNELGNYIESLDYVANDSSINNVLAIIDNNLPLFLEGQDYKLIDSLTTTAGIVEKLNANYHTLTGATGLVLKKFIVNDPLGLNFIAYKKLTAFQPDGQMELYEQHFITKDKKHALLFINPRYGSSETSQNIIFFKKLDELISKLSVNSKFNIVYYGAPAVAACNAAQIRKDTLLTTTITLILLIVIVMLFFRKLYAPLLMIIPVIFGTLFALAVIYFLKGETSVIAIAAGSLVLGIAVNYSLHFLTHHRYHPDVRGAIKELSFPMTLGSATTIGGFLCLQFVKAPVLRDLGLFAALSLIGAAFASLVVLPHFINDKKTIAPSAVSSRSLIYERLLQKLQANRYFVWAFVLLTPILLYFAPAVQFENDMNNINYVSPSLKQAEKVINQFSSYYQKSVFIVAKANSLDEALARSERILPVLDKLKADKKIISYTGASSFLLSEKEQQKRIARWQAYWTREKREQVLNLLIAEGKKLHFKESAFAPLADLLKKEFKGLSHEASETFKTAFLKNFIEEKNGTYSAISLVKSTPENVKEVYSGLMPFTDLIVFDRQYITNTLVKVVGQDFNFITLFSSLLVFVALLLSYGRIELALITFIPMVVSWIWILGIMALLGIKFNIINIILSTFVFGLGDDYAIFTTDGLQQEYATGKKALTSVRISILLSAITTIVGLGILVFAKHPALNSIALVSIIGITCVWLISQTLQPLLFNLLIKNQTEKKLSPYTLWGLIKTAFAFIYFVAGALLLTFIGFVLTRIIPLKKQTMKYTYHWVLNKFVASLVYLMANVKKLILNEYNENFSRPAVIIANHQSFLDILALAMLHPKLILITNSWVWNSPVFGAVVRMADFYPAANGVESSLDKFAARVKEGYSIVVFPEGTRSSDGVIKRFHKGAFYLAEKLQIDVLPIVLHGTGHCMTKGDFFLKDGQITVKYLPRIQPGNSNYGANYSERAKLIGKYMRQQYVLLQEHVETPAYFKDRLISSFLFKGPVLEWYMKVKLKLENNYTLFDQLLPRQGAILDLGCGYGFMSYMLGYTSSGRTVKGIDYDEDKIAVAQHGYLKGGNVSFEQGDVVTYTFSQFDAVILSDVLHYLQPEEQTALLEKCVYGLKPNGTIVIRDGIKELTERHKGTRLTELFSTRIVNFNKTSEKGLAFLSARLITQLAEKHRLKLLKIDNTRFTSNVIFVLKRQD